jgi:hypothetical protein
MGGATNGLKSVSVLMPLPPHGGGMDSTLLDCISVAVSTSARSCEVQAFIACPVADPCSCHLGAPLRLKSRSETFFTAD